MGPKGQRQAAKDLADAGYLVFSVNHRSAPPRQITDQPEHDPAHPENGRPPQQTNDIKQQIMAARHDGQCTGTVFVIGGSSGGSHAFWTAMDPVANGVPGWGQSEIPQAVVGFSGAYDLSLRLGDNPDDLADFIRTIRNYTNTTAPDTAEKLETQRLVSAVSRVPLVNISKIPPLRLFNTEFDPMPYQQLDAMVDALQDIGFQHFEATKILGISKHAFDYWHTREFQNGPLVSDDVIAFFDSNLP